MIMPIDMKEHNRQLIEQFRASGRMLEGRPLLLLTTKGAKTGKEHTVPMMYVPDGERLLVIASNAGSPKDPDWYRNLAINPNMTVEVAGEEYNANAIDTKGHERDRLWARIVELYPFFADHQAQVSRRIPVVALVRITD